MKNLAKGANAERQLLKKFLEMNWGGIRIAGSGQMQNAPDLLVGHPGRLFLIECKTCKKDARYLDRQEILNVIDYANKFGGEPWYAVKFNRLSWKFIPATTLLADNKITPEFGILFENFILKDRKTM